ncbi:MAG TPA: lytic transglycosylase domain-containing protein [Longimicrobiales bacterium]
MIRNNPKVRALCERVRRPNTIRILAGLALMTPAGLMTMRDAEQAKPTTAAILLAPVKAIAPALSGEARAEVVAPEYAREYKIPTSLAKRIYSAAVANNISPRTAFGLVRAESSFRTAATSPVGATGLTQLMPATARWLAPGTTRQQLKDPDTNLRIGFKYLRSLVDKYDGDEKLALTAFNRGPGTVDRLLKRGRNPDNGYAEKVLTGKSTKHVALMNKKFGRKQRRS